MTEVLTLRGSSAIVATMSVKSQQLQIRVSAEQKRALQERASRAGQTVSTYVLSRALPPEQLRFGEILHLLRDRANRRFGLADLNDLLSSLAPGELRRAVADADLGELSPYTQNYVSAMVEQACGRGGIEPPGWTRGIEPLVEPRFATALAGLRLHLLRRSPVPFKRRNIFVDSAVGDRV